MPGRIRAADLPAELRRKLVGRVTRPAPAANPSDAAARRRETAVALQGLREGAHLSGRR